MSVEISLHKLLKRGISQRISTKTFNSLYLQLENLQQFPENEYVTEFLELKSGYQVQLVLGQVLDSPTNLEKFWKNLGKLPETDQLTYINKIPSFLLNTSTEVTKGLFGPTFQEYVLSNLTNDGLVYKIVFLIANYVNQTTPTIEFQGFAIKLFKTLKKLKYEKLVEFLYLRLRLQLNNDSINLLVSENIGAVVEVKIEDRPMTSSLPTIKTTSITNLSQTNFDRYIGMKKYFWFKKIMREWKFAGTEDFLYSFNVNFSTKGNVLVSLIQSIFISLEYAILDNERLYVIFNWKNFILTRLPLILKDSNDVEKAIIEAFSSQKLSNDKITVSFVKSCIFNKVLPVESFAKIFPLVPYVELSDTNWNLTSKFNEKLLHVNVEFTSLEESGFIDFVNSLYPLLEYSHIKQKELSELFNKTLDDLMILKDYEKLNRLLLAFLNNVQLVNIISFNNSPYEILGKLINFIDKESFQIDLNDENFQEFYSYFGVLLLGVILIIETFDINLSQYKIKGSFVLEYLNGFYYRLVDNMTNQMPGGSNEEDMTVVMNYNGLFNDWVNALFDDKNDGLSDELIKSVNIKQIYKLVPIIYQQSIVATKVGTINFEILTNGIDYLSQVFLIPCTVSIINWLLNKFQANDEMLYVKVLYEIIKSNFNEIEEIGQDELPKTVVSSLIFKIVLQISGNKILSTLKRVKDWQNSSQILSIIKIVEMNIDLSYVEQTVVYEGRNDVEVQFKEYLVSGPKVELNNLQVAELFRRDPLKLIGLLLDEVERKNNNEDALLTINLGVVLMVLDGVSNKEEKLHWLSIFSLEPLKAQAEGDHNDYGDQFELSEDNHFSSIFDVDEDNDPNVKLEVRDEIDDMIVDDDDLFDDPINVVVEKPSTSEVLSKLVSYVHSTENSLAKFDRLRAESGNKLIKLLTDSIIHELDLFQI